MAAAVSADPAASNQRYSLTFSVNARNLFNIVNDSTPAGSLGSQIRYVECSGRRGVWKWVGGSRNPTAGAIQLLTIFRSLPNHADCRSRDPQNAKYMM